MLRSKEKRVLEIFGRGSGDTQGFIGPRKKSERKRFQVTLWGGRGRFGAIKCLLYAGELQRNATFVRAFGSEGGK